MAKMHTLNANSDVALESELAAKADEFTPWVITGSQSSGASIKWLPDDEVWGLFFGGTTDNYAGKNQFATEILPSDWSDPIDITATRKRVLRTGDADKLTDAQKAVLAGGPYVPMSVGDEEAYKTARIQAASLARLLIDSGLEAAIELSSGDETIRLAVTMSSGASIKKNGKEVATEDQLRVTMQLVGNDPYTVQLDGETLTFAQIKELAQTRNAVIQRGQGTYRVTYIGSTEMMWDVTGSVAGNVQTGQIHIFDQNDVTVVQRVEPKVLATKAMLDNRISATDDGFKSAVEAIFDDGETEEF